MNPGDKYEAWHLIYRRINLCTIYLLCRKKKLYLNARPTSNCPCTNDKGLKRKILHFRVVGIDKRKWTFVQKLAASLKIKLSIQILRNV